MAADALDKQHPYEPFPGTDATCFIQWKGTDVCLDVHCACGHHGHFDGDFAYFVQCPACGAVYELGTQVKLVKTDDHYDPKMLDGNPPSPERVQVWQLWRIAPGEPVKLHEVGGTGGTGQRPGSLPAPTSPGQYEVRLNGEVVEHITRYRDPEPSW